MRKFKVFISRKLGKNSEFRKALHECKVEIIDEYLIEFQPISFDSPTTEWLFFYSKSGIKYFLESGGNHLDHKIAVFGPSSGEYFQFLTNYQPDFIGNAEKYAVAQEFAKQDNFKSSTFVVAESSLRSVQKIIGCPSHQEVVVYKNEPKRNFHVDSPDIAVFTSPLSAKIYFSKYGDRGHANIAIGKTTAGAIEKMGKKVLDIPEISNERELARTLNSHLRMGL